MNWIHLTWRMEVREENERNDEPALQFAIVTIVDGQVLVHGHDTGSRIRKGTGLNWGNIRSGRSVPSTDNPYLGIVIRAIELDNSGDCREVDRKTFFEDIKNYTQDIVDSRRIPTANQLLAAGTQHNLINNAGDDDDRIGVNAMAFPDFGSAYMIDKNIIRYTYNLSFTDTREGNQYSNAYKAFTNLPFKENGAYYDLIGSVRITPDEPVPSYP